jgi:hypothetical protein
LQNQDLLQNPLILGKLEKKSLLTRWSLVTMIEVADNPKIGDIKWDEEHAVSGCPHSSPHCRWMRVVAVMAHFVRNVCPVLSPRSFPDQQSYNFFTPSTAASTTAMESRDTFFCHFFPLGYSPHVFLATTQVPRFLL